MTRPFDSFVVFAGMRTGSNLLEEQLNRLEGIFCAGELFNPRFVGHPKQAAYLGFDLGARIADPLALLAALRGQPGLNGFRFFHDHDPRVLDTLLADRRCAKIILNRNPLDSYISRKIAAATGQWKLSDVKQKRATKVDFDASDFAAYVEATQAFQLHLLRALQVSGQTAFHLGYDDLGVLSVLNGLAAWLGVASRLTDLAGRLKPQNPEPPEAKVTNPEALASGLARLDRFDLARVPNFEPQRGPRLGTWRVGLRAPVLFMPIPGAPQDAVLDWMAALDGAQGRQDLPAALGPRALHAWQIAHPHRCCFTVVRHPLARAHAVFCTEVLAGGRSGVRGYLARVHGVDPGEGAAHDRARHREGFLAFLRFIQANLAGQTGLPVQPSWASQTMFIEGFRAQAVPDRILHEDRLPSQLAQLAQELGLQDAASFRSAPEDEGVARDLPFDKELQAACKAAYALDYRVLGFGDWPQAR